MTKIQLLQEIIAFLLRMTMLPVVMREIFQKNRVTILVYHKIPAPVFERHIKYLKRHYSIISLDKFIKARYQGCLEKLPVKPMVITFDDGAKPNYSLRSILQKYRVPATMFICSEISGTNRHFWFSYLDRVKTNLKAIPDSERLKLLSRIGFDEKKEYLNPDAMSQEEISELLNAGISIQSHTSTHPILPMCDAKKAEFEINSSKAILEDKFGIKVYCLAYPNGDYLQRDVEYCKRAGYLAAVTMDAGFNNAGTDVYKLKRISIGDYASINQLVVKSSGLWSVLKGNFKHKSSKIEKSRVFENNTNKKAVNIT